ncbi:MAG TPA: Holliday junction branch migration protein RuvA [Aggregatilineales bacterium]|nr:Holliday junction branch migration protein RuvA [Aggregatilineales bacterium]
MIDIVSGQVASLDKNSVVVMVGGVGFRVNVPRTVFDVVTGPGQSVTLYTNLVVREDSLTLFGFISEEERSIYEILTSVSGVGPRLGLAILSALSIDQLRGAIGRQEPEILTRVPGIGKKTAEKIIFELKGKVGDKMIPVLLPVSDVDADVIAALTSMGYSVVEAQTAIQSIPREAAKDLETRLLLALQYFG